LDLQFFQNEYEIAERVLGIGGFGRVHLAVNKLTGEQLACKIIGISHLTGDVLKLQGMERPKELDAAEDLRVRREGRKFVKKVMRQLKTHDKEHEILAKLDHVSRSQTTSRRSHILSLTQNIPTAQHHQPPPSDENKHRHVRASPNLLSHQSRIFILTWFAHPH
jgi:protein-serine/threonine kinase